MIRVVICDDSPEQLEYVSKVCGAYLKGHPSMDPKLITFSNPLDCLEGLERIGGCDIALLDICMPGISGIQVARELRDRWEHTQIIFLTASKEYAVDAFSVGALHYLLKPFTQPQFDEAMDRAVKKLRSAAARKILINGEGGAVVTVDARDILYVESFRNGRSVCTVGETYTETKRTLQVMLDELNELCPGQFVSPYRGYIVNYGWVKAISAEGIRLKNDKIIPIKPDSFRKLRAAYFAYEFGRRD